MEGMKQPPGLMLYDKDFLALSWLGPENCLKLLTAAFDYKNTGKLPELPNDLTDKWPFVQTLVDNDLIRYAKNQSDTSYGGYKKNYGDGALPRDEYEHARNVITIPNVLKSYFQYAAGRIKTNQHYNSPEEYKNRFEKLSG